MIGFDRAVAVSLLWTAPVTIAVACGFYWNYRQALAEPASDEWMANARSIRTRNILVRSWYRGTLYALRVRENPRHALRLAVFYGVAGLVLFALGLFGLATQ